MIYAILIPSALLAFWLYYQQGKKPIYKIGDAVEYQRTKFYISVIEQDSSFIHIRTYSADKYYSRLLEKRVHVSEIKPYKL